MDLVFTLGHDGRVLSTLALWMSRRAFLAMWLLAACVTTIAWWEQSSSVKDVVKENMIVIVTGLLATDAEIDRIRPAVAIRGDDDEQPEPEVQVAATEPTEGGRAP